MNERELTTKILNQLEFQTGLIARVTEYESPPGSEDHTDALIQFGYNNAKLVAELKKWVVDGDLAAVVDEITAVTGGKDKILISNYIDDEAGLRLREAKVNYLDMAGNAYLDIAPVYVLIQGKLPKEALHLDRTARLFTETGLKVIFALLANRKLLNASYRKIADHANVSMGTIGWVLRELKDQGFTQENYRSREWKNKPRLIRKWAEEYPNLRSKIFLGSFFCENRDWWQTIELEKYAAVLGGEIAAVSYASNLRPRSGTVYVGKHKHRALIHDLGLVKVDEDYRGPSANVEILSKFWGHAEDHSLLSNATHPLITYADLMDTWDSVSRDLAAQIADKYFGPRDL